MLSILGLKAKLMTKPTICDRITPNSTIINLKQQSYAQTKFLLHRNNRRTVSINCVNSGGEDKKISQPFDGVEIRFKRGSRRTMRREEGSGEGGGQNGKKQETVQKPWEEMTLNEKALELYVGEKGLLFWLNKLAYASIYIVIGGWILFPVCWTGFESLSARYTAS